MITPLLFSLALAQPVPAATPHARIQDGFRGHPWGVSEFTPDPTCVPTKEDNTILYACPDKVGDVPVRITWGYQYGIMHSVLVYAETAANCQRLLAVATAKWGTPAFASKYKQGAMDERLWTEFAVNGQAYGGTWTYRSITASCNLVLVSMADFETVQGKIQTDVSMATGNL